MASEFVDYSPGLMNRRYLQPRKDVKSTYKKALEAMGAMTPVSAARPPAPPVPTPEDLGLAEYYRTPVDAAEDEALVEESPGRAPLEVGTTVFNPDPEGGQDQALAQLIRAVTEAKARRDEYFPERTESALDYLPSGALGFPTDYKIARGALTSGDRRMMKQLADVTKAQSEAPGLLKPLGYVGKLLSQFHPGRSTPEALRTRTRQLEQEDVRTRRETDRYNLARFEALADIAKEARGDLRDYETRQSRIGEARKAREDLADYREKEHKLATKRAELAVQKAIGAENAADFYRRSEEDKAKATIIATLIDETRRDLDDVRLSTEEREDRQAYLAKLMWELGKGFPELAGPIRRGTKDSESSGKGFIDKAVDVLVEVARAKLGLP